MAVASGVPMVGAPSVADGLGKGGKDAQRDFLVAAKHPVLIVRTCTTEADAESNG